MKDIMATGKRSQIARLVILLTFVSNTLSGYLLNFLEKRFSSGKFADIGQEVI